MTTTLETPDELIERLERMGLDRVRSLVGLNHFEPKARGLVKGWMARKEEELKAPPVPEAPPAAPSAPAPERDTAEVQEALRLSRRAISEAKAASQAVVQMQRLNSIAIGTATVAVVVSILSLFALALT